MKIVDVKQNTPEWYAAKCGIPSASEFDKIITAKGEPSKQRLKYLYKKAGERASKITEETYQNNNMLRGKELEDEARKLYCFMKNVKVKQTGFCVTDKEPIYGCSPDGVVPMCGLLEIKCPIMSTHVGYLMGNKLPSEYFPQIQGQLLVTGRKWVDFFSYYPGLKPLIVRVYRDKTFLRLLEPELTKFCHELNQLAKKIRRDK